MDDKKRKEIAASLLKDMEATSARMRELIVAMPPHDLLGYIVTVQRSHLTFIDGLVHYDSRIYFKGVMNGISTIQT